jgi:hypothetical protein
MVPRGMLLMLSIHIYGKIFSNAHENVVQAFKVQRLAQISNVQSISVYLQLQTCLYRWLMHTEIKCRSLMHKGQPV